MGRSTAGLHDNKVEFRNNTEGYIGVVTYAPNGDEKPVAIEPGGTVWLSPAEQELTAKAPREAKDNPFISQRVPIIDADTGDVIDHVNVTPLTENTEVRPTPAATTARERQVAAAAAQSAQPPRGDDAPDGTHGALEEVGTPAAQSPAARRRRRAPAKATTKK